MKSIRYSNTHYHCDAGVLYPYLYMQTYNGWIYEAFYNEVRTHRSESTFRANSLYVYGDLRKLNAYELRAIARDDYTIASYILAFTEKDFVDQATSIDIQNHMFDRQSTFIWNSSVIQEDRSNKIKSVPTVTHSGYEFILPLRRKDFLLDISIFWCDKRMKDLRLQRGQDVLEKRVPITLYDYQEICFDWRDNKVYVREKNVLHKFDPSFPEQPKELVFNKKYGDDRREGVNAYFNVMERACLENPDLIVELTL